ncbi:hypothetical protein B0H19DRAFT_127494 [Mycena capillaripes]|nr:hypothetical protein B0H19DRAFT_127494 [Mycena capillaripes]
MNESPASVLAALRQSGARNLDGSELTSLRPRKRARQDPHASDLGPWGTLPETFDGLLVPAISEDHSQSKHTAPYSASHISLLFPEFSYFEDDLPTDLSRIYQRLIKGKRNGKFSAISHQLWDSMAVQGGLRGLTSATGYNGEDFVAKASHQFSQLVASILTDIDASPLDDDDSADFHPAMYVVQQGQYSQRRGASSLCFRGGAASAGLSQEHKTTLVLDSHCKYFAGDYVFSNTRHVGVKAIIFKLFLQMHCLERELNSRDLSAVLIDSDHELFTREFSAAEVEEACTHVDIQVNYGIVYTGHKCVLAKRAYGIGRDGTRIHGLALSPIYVAAGPGANLPFLAMLVAAHAEVQDDSPRRPSAERWEVLLKMVEEERERFAKERVRLLAEMEQRRNQDSSRPPSPSGNRDGGGNGGGNDGGGNEGGGKDSGSGNPDEGARGAVKGHAQAYYLHLHFDYPGCSTLPSTLFKITTNELKAHLVPSPPPSPPGSSFADHTCLPESAITWAQDIILHTPHLYIRQQLPSADIVQVFRAELVTEDRPAQLVVLKLYGAHHLPDLLREVSAYDRLRRRLTSLVPDVLGIFCSIQDQGWFGLLLDDRGVRVGSDSWASVVLTSADKHCLFDALLQLHTAGVVHNDFFPRNVLRRPDGTFSLIDFGSATVEHDCPGDACPELAKLRMELKI